MGEDERWIVVLGACFGLKVGIKIKFAENALNKSNAVCKSNVVLIVNKYCFVVRL